MEEVSSEVANNITNKRGQDCRMKENIGLLFDKNTVASPEVSQFTRKLTPGRGNNNTSQTTPIRRLGTTMKVKSNNSRRKVTKMTQKEEEDIKKTTADIRLFFEGRATTTTDTTKVSQTASRGVGAKPRTTSPISEVSPSLAFNNPVVSRILMRSRRPDVHQGTGRSCEPGRSELGACKEPQGGGDGTTIVRTERCDDLCGQGGVDVKSVCLGEQPQRAVEYSDVYKGVGRRKPTQLDVDRQTPGSMLDEGGGGEVCGGGGRVRIPEGGDELVPLKAQLKTKPKRAGGGGLSAKIHLWEMKSGGLLDENSSDRRATEDSSAGTSCVLSNRKWNTAPLEQHGQD